MGLARMVGLVPWERWQPDLVVVSNRGPCRSPRRRRALVAKRGAGGLVSILGPAIADRGATWIAAAITDEDREAAAGGLVEAEGFRLRQLVVDEADYRMFYDVIANATLWFLHHGLFDLPRRPRFDRHWHEAWEGYRRVNAAFAQTVAEEAAEGATVLVQDYHLSLLGAELRRLRPDLRAVHFHHTPFCGPDLDAHAARPGRSRAARGPGRPPRLRLPRPPLG